MWDHLQAEVGPVSLGIGSSGVNFVDQYLINSSGNFLEGKSDD